MASPSLARSGHYRCSRIGPTGLRQRIAADAAETARSGAERGHHRVGLGRSQAYLHDEIATDKRNPTLNANGLIYGAAELSVDYLPVLNPVSATASQVKVPVRDPKTPSSADDKIAAPSPYWGDEAIWHSQANVHNPMFDAQGRVWITSRIRPSENLAFCKEARATLRQSYSPQNERPATRCVRSKDEAGHAHNTCFGTHHLVFAEDANNTLWTSSGGGGEPSVGWIQECSTRPTMRKNRRAGPR